MKVSDNCAKNVKTTSTHKNLTDLGVDIENPLWGRVGAGFSLEIKTMYTFGNGKNDRKRHFLTKTPF